MRARLTSSIRHIPALGAPLLLALTGCCLIPKNSPCEPQTSVPPSLYGDWPADEAVPSDGPLLPNLVRHSFTTEGVDFDPDVSATDGWIVFASTRQSELPNLFLKRYAGTTLTQLTDAGAADIQPRFSPDGRRIAFASSRAGSWDLWLLDRETLALTQLTDDPADELAPAWSPDGRQIAYTRWSQTGQHWEIWVLEVEEAGVRHYLGPGMFPAWSPDGRHLAVQRSRQRGSRLFGIWTFELRNGEAILPTEVAASDGAACISPSWSPDARRLVFCLVPENHASNSQRSLPHGGTAELWVVDVPTGLRTRLTGTGLTAFNPVWSRDDRVFFVSPRAGSENIWSIGAPVPLPTDEVTFVPQHERSDSGEDSVTSTMAGS